MTSLTPIQLHTDSCQFTGSETFFRYSILFPKTLLTEGAKYVADKAECYWLIDDISALQLNVKAKADGLQVWKIVLDKKGDVCVICSDGNGNAIHRQRIDYTDFPLDIENPEFTFWVADNGAGITIMLPSEY